MRMIERSQKLCFPLKAAHSLAIPDKLLRQDLQRHLPSQPGVDGPIDRTHPSFPKLGGDLVVGDGLAYQRASRLLGSLCGNTRSLTLEGQCQGTAYLEIGRIGGTQSAFFADTRNVVRCEGSCA